MTSLQPVAKPEVKYNQVITAETADRPALASRAVWLGLRVTGVTAPNMDHVNY